MELHTAHPLAQVSGKTFETNETNTTNPILVQIFKGTVWGCTENDQTPRKGISYLIHRFGFACSFPDFEHETDKAEYAYLDPLAILRFYTEPPIGVAKVVIKNGIRIAF